ncbi:hypothetical protein SUGI_0627070 [Cryptomeria japonica]|nr:hypothetical protein SUGI_0627070 [Cryptomeria japonica]
MREFSAFTRTHTANLAYVGKSTSKSKPTIQPDSIFNLLIGNGRGDFTEEIYELVSTQSNGNPVNCKSSNRNKVGSGGRGRGGSGRKSFAQGPRSGNKSISMLVVGWEDHRVVSTEYQWWAGGAEVEVVMNVTLLAAGFGIGARGASVREIQIQFQSNRLHVFIISPIPIQPPIN